MRRDEGRGGERGEKRKRDLIIFTLAFVLYGALLLLLALLASRAHADSTTCTVQYYAYRRKKLLCLFTVYIKSKLVWEKTEHLCVTPAMTPKCWFVDSLKKDHHNKKDTSLRLQCPRLKDV